VIVEPLHRCLPPAPGFLDAVRAACSAHGVILIFDEVVTGFRLAVAGAQERYGVVPDLVAYGKALGGGHPLGAYGGRGDIMDIVREERLGGDEYVWTASTLGGNPVSCAAALALLDQRARSGRITLGADKAYDVRQFIDDLRARGVIPHVAVDGHIRITADGSGRPRSSAIDARTTRHTGYALSQRSRKRIEEIFGWIKVSAGLARVKLRGRDRVDAAFRLALSAYNLIRLPKLLGAA
jgi:glutamate-1-semialdehyde aminotransferase